MADMKGQVALVTGGIRGIGLAICERLINRGVTVAAGYSANQEAARQIADKYAGSGATIHQGNIGSYQDCVRVIGEVIDAHGQLDVLVNNAGITVDKTVRKMAPEEWDHVIHVNLSGAFYLSKAVLQHMLDRGYGRIINISSVIGSACGFGQANYAAAKSGMFGLTMSLALETASKGITVNSVTPGFITTDMTAAVPANVMEKIVDRIPVGRPASRTRSPAWWSSWPTPNRPTSPARSWTGRDRTPSVPGHELSGVVTELGYGTTGLTVGQRVFGLADWTRDGSLAEYTAVEARNLAPLAADIDHTVAAALPISGLTAWQGLFDHAHLKTGQTVLIHGAAGGVGSIAAQLAHELGARVIGTGRTGDREAALGLGAGAFVDLQADRLEDAGEVDVAFDVIGG